MKKLFLFAALMTAMVVSATDVATTVFSVTGNENKTFGDATSITNGTPAVTFTYAQSVFQGDAPAAPSFNSTNFISVNGKYLESGTSPSGRNMLMGDISGFASPFNPVLKNTDADSIVWTFNMRSSDPNGANGLGRGKRSTAAVLAMDNNNLLEGNGYAIINRKNTSNKADYELVRVTNGLDTVTNITSLISYTTTKKGPYMVFKVVYIPATDKWIMYCLDVSSAESKWPNPDTVTYEKAGEATDATFTSNTMKAFGFYNGYHGTNTYYNLNARNYVVRTFKNDTPVEPEPEQDPKPYVAIYSASFTANTKTELADLAYGTPQVTWTNTKINYTPELQEAATPSMQSQLDIAGRYHTDNNTTKGRNILTAPMTGFEEPWTDKLNESEADSLVWMFNMRYNYSYTGGFDNAQRGIATVLAMDGSDMMTANGYAIVSNESYYYRLVRFDGGLSANANITALASTEKLTKIDGTGSSNLRYMSFRVVYAPATETWKMYYFANTESSFLNPVSVENWTLANTVVDNTHTGKAMTHFGFMNNYVGPQNSYTTLSVKNFSLGAYYEKEESGPTTDVETTKIGEKCRKILRNGQLIILRDGKEYNILGSLVQ